jgi:HPr kinase/phosphorylase
MQKLENVKQLEPKNVPVEVLLRSPAHLTVLSGNVGLKNEITNKNIYRPQLALAGYVEIFNFRSVQMFGNTEIIYLKSLSNEKRIEAFRTIANFPVPCIILTNDNHLEPEMMEIALNSNIAVFSTTFDTTKAFYLLSEFLDDQFAPQAVVHGSLIDVYGVGIMFVGRSGIGKSEVALDLVERGHRLVGDDVIMFTKKRESILMGTSTALAKHFMEIRGIGIIDIRQMFGIRAIRFQKRLEIIAYLEEWDIAKEYTRVGMDEEPTELLGVEIPSVRIPIFPGKNITVIAEVVAINYLLRTYGYDSSKVFAQNLQAEIRKKTEPKTAFQDQRIISWFQSDDE